MDSPSAISDPNLRRRNFGKKLIATSTNSIQSIEMRKAFWDLLWLKT